MIKNNKKLIIVGIGETADLAYEYFTSDSDYEVTSFTVSKECSHKKTFNSLKIYELESLHEMFDPKSCDGSVDYRGSNELKNLSLQNK